MKIIVSLFCFSLIASLFYTVEPLRPVSNNNYRTLAKNQDLLKYQILKASRENPYFLKSLKAIKHYRGHAHLDKSIKTYTEKVLKSIESKDIKKQLQIAIDSRPVENFIKFQKQLDKISDKNQNVNRKISSIKMDRFDVLGNKL
jgi:hypothetical protein